MTSYLLKCVVFCSLLVSPHGSIASALSMTREDGSEITFYLKSQSTENATDLLVLMQGSDCNSVAHNKRINQQFSQVLPEADVLTVEKYGITSGLSWDLRNDERADCPTAYIMHDSLNKRTTDYLMVIEQLKERGSYERVILLGGSEGATVANMVAAKADFVTANISLNGGGRKFQNTVLHFIKENAKTKEQDKKNSEDFNGFVRHIMTSEPFELNRGDHGYKWWASSLKLDQLEILGQIETPVLIVQGGNDLNVSPKAVEDMITKLKDRGKDNITYSSYPLMNHAFETPNGDSMAYKVISDIQEWLGNF